MITDGKDQTNMQNITDELLNKGIKPSFIRVSVLNYLRSSFDHPTIDLIYNSLKPTIPTLSKTSVYNTVELLADFDLINVVTIDKNESRYDGNIEFHGHFKCEKCNKLYDFPLLNLVYGDLEGFSIKSKDVYFTGVCRKCLKVYL